MSEAGRLQREEGRRTAVAHRAPVTPVGRAAMAVLFLAFVALGCQGPGESGGLAQPAATWTSVPRPTASETPLPTVTPAVAPTNLPYKVPALLAPLPGAEVSGSSVHLRWSWEGSLSEKEWFELWIWPRGLGERSMLRAKAAQSDCMPPGGVGVHFWKVRVVQGMPGQPEPVALSPWSETRSFDYRGPQVSATPTPLLPRPSPTGA